MRGETTIGEVLVVLVLAALGAFLIVPALTQSRTGPRRSISCQSFLHNTGISIETFRVDHGGLWDYGPCNVYLNYGGCQLLDLAMDGEYFEDPGILRCPRLDTPYPREPHNRYIGASSENCRQPQPDGPFARSWGIEEISYFLDEHRVARNSDSRRAMAADGIEMCTKYGVEPANHKDGANVLFLDLAVQWVPKVSPHQAWSKRSVGLPGDARCGYSRAGAWPDYPGAKDPPGTESPEVTGALTALGFPPDTFDVDWMYCSIDTEWIRYGYTPNPRISEDDNESDLDDVYECEGETPDTFYSWALYTRCDPGKRMGRPDARDAAVAGGCLLQMGQGEGWRGAEGPFYDDGVGDGLQGVTWGTPAAFVR
jgi:hypothetical protein